MNMMFVIDGKIVTAELGGHHPARA